MASIYYIEKLSYQDKYFEAKNAILTFKNSRNLNSTEKLQGQTEITQTPLDKLSASVRCQELAKLLSDQSGVHSQKLSGSSNIVDIVLLNEKSACKLIAAYLGSTGNFGKLSELVSLGKVKEDPLSRVVLHIDEDIPLSQKEPPTATQTINDAQNKLFTENRLNNNGNNTICYMYFKTVDDVKFLTGQTSAVSKLFGCTIPENDVPLTSTERSSNTMTSEDWLTLARNSRKQKMGEHRGLTDPRTHSMSTALEILPITKKVMKPSIEPTALKQERVAHPTPSTPRPFSFTSTVASLAKPPTRVVIVMTYDAFAYWCVSMKSFRIWMLEPPIKYKDLQAVYQIKSRLMPAQESPYEYPSAEGLVQYLPLQWTCLLHETDTTKTRKFYQLYFQAQLAAGPASNPKNDTNLEWVYRHIYAPIMRGLAEESYHGLFPTTRLGGFKKSVTNHYHPLGVNASTIPTGIAASSSDVSFGLKGAILSLATANEILTKFCAFLPKTDNVDECKKEKYLPEHELTLVLLGSWKTIEKGALRRTGCLM